MWKCSYNIYSKALTERSIPSHISAWACRLCKSSKRSSSSLGNRWNWSIISWLSAGLSTLDFPLALCSIKWAFSLACFKEVSKLASWRYRIRGFFKLLTKYLLDTYIVIPYSTEITPTLIACYKAATGGMGLISKTVVCLEIKPTQVSASKLWPLMKKLSLFLSASEAWQLFKMSIYNNSSARVKSTATM